MCIDYKLYKEDTRSKTNIGLIIILVLAYIHYEQWLQNCIVSVNRKIAIFSEVFLNRDISVVFAFSFTGNFSPPTFRGENEVFYGVSVLIL